MEQGVKEYHDIKKEGIMMRDYNYIDKLQEEVKAGGKHLYLFGKPLNVTVWYDCFFGYRYNRETGEDEIYYSVEGKTEENKYFNIKSTDSIAKHIVIK